MQLVDETEHSEQGQVQTLIKNLLGKKFIRIQDIEINKLINTNIKNLLKIYLKLKKKFFTLAIYYRALKKASLTDTLLISLPIIPETSLTIINLAKTSSTWKSTQLTN